MDKIRDIATLLRWQNLLFVAIVLWVMESWVAQPILNHIQFGAQLSPLILWLLILSTMLIAAGGYVINDYFDVKIDKINKPDKLVVTQSVTRQQAMYLSIALSAFGCIGGMVVAWLCHSKTLGSIFLFTPGLLWFYSSSYKRQLIVGNIIVALLAGITPLLIAVANVAILQANFGDILQYTHLEKDLYSSIGGFALFAFLLTLAREIVKDAEDQTGDRELECHSIPIVWGEPAAKIIVTVILLVVVALLASAWWMWLPWPHVWHSPHTRYIVYGMLIPILCEIALLWAAKIPSDFHTAQELLKFIQLLGTLFGWVVLRML